RRRHTRFSRDWSSDVCSSDLRTVLTRVVTVAEETGKEIHPLVVPTNNPLFAIATAARDLGAKDVVLGESEKVSNDELAEQFALRSEERRVGKEWRAGWACGEG